MRRLPIYLLIDCSGSMSGTPIESVQNGVETLIDELRQNPYALETAYISVITFEDVARQEMPLTDLLSFSHVDFDADGSTSMGKAFELLNNCLDKEIIKGTKEQKGDWKPLVFLFTDGQPTDDIQNGVKLLKNHNFGNFVICGSDGFDASEMKFITKEIANSKIIELENLDEDGIKDFFKWVSSSIALKSQKIGESATEEVDIYQNLPTTAIVV